MEWLNIWLKKIILLVLLAAFLDLILPNTSMQRYVKMVMGLILLLTILGPVFSIFNLSQEELAFRLSRYQEDFQNATKTQWQPLAKKLQEQQSQQVTSYLQQQIESTIRMQVKEAYGVEPETVEVALDGSQTDQSVIRTISLIMPDDHKQTDAGAVQAIKPIEAVTIDVSLREAQPADTGTRQTRAEDVRIKQWLAQSWQIDADQVEVIRKTSE